MVEVRLIIQRPRERGHFPLNYQGDPSNLQPNAQNDEQQGPPPSSSSSENNKGDSSDGSDSTQPPSSKPDMMQAKAKMMKQQRPRRETKKTWVKKKVMKVKQIWVPKMAVPTKKKLVHVEKPRRSNTTYSKHSIAKGNSICGISCDKGRLSNGTD